MCIQVDLEHVLATYSCNQWLFFMDCVCQFVCLSIQSKILDRVLPTLVGSGNARPVLYYPDQYLPSPTSTNATQLAALHYRWVQYRVSQWGIFSHMHMSESALCVNLNQVDDVHLELLLMSTHSLWWQLWAVAEASVYQCGQSWQQLYTNDHLSENAGQNTD